MRRLFNAVALAAMLFCETGAFADMRPALVSLVRQDCGSCHGMTLKGGLGAPLLPDALADKETESLISIILDGVPNTPMPPWRGLLSEADARWIAEQLKKGFPQ
ncbi:MAG: cytochrome c [Beijerinckiaceae bacterium]